MTALPNEESSEQTEIRALIDDLAEGIRAKDVDGVMSFYADERVQFLLAPPLKYSGANATKGEDLKDWFSSFQGPIGYEIRDLEVSTGSQIAFGHSLNRMSGTKIDGARTDLWFRWTVCFRKLAASGKSRTNMNRCRSTWTAATKRLSILNLLVGLAVARRFDLARPLAQKPILRWQWL